MQNFSQKIDQKYFPEIIKRYQRYQIETKNPHIEKAFKTDLCSINLYKNGTFHLFGENILTEKEFIENLIQKKTGQTIGSDEVGTGDIFGPIVVCCVYLSRENAEEIKTYNISDSKSLNDSEIIRIAEFFIPRITYSVLILENEKYNQIVKTDNMNAIKAKLHNRAILNVKEKIRDEKDEIEVIVDQFCETKHYFQYLQKELKVYRKINFHTKGESYALSVAMASIFARYTFLKKFAELEKQYGLTLIKGASNPAIERVKEIVNERGKEIFKKIAKINFKTFEKLNIFF